MLKIELSRKQILSFYMVVATAGLLFIITTSPLASQPAIEGQQTVRSSLSNFILNQLDLKYERNVATWFSSCLLFLAGVVALLNSGLHSSDAKLKYFRRAGWALISLLLIGLSADETAMIHESLAPLYNSMNAGDGSAQVRVGAGDWLPLLLPLIIISAAGMGAFVWLTFRGRRRLLALSLAGILCWAGAILAESIEAEILRIDLSRAVEGMIEEGLEIAGTTLLLIAFMEFNYMSSRADAGRDRRDAAA